MTPTPLSQKNDSWAREEARGVMRNSLPLGELDNYADSKKLHEAISQALLQARQRGIEEAAKVAESFKVRRFQNKIYAEHTELFTKPMPVIGQDDIAKAIRLLAKSENEKTNE